MATSKVFGWQERFDGCENVQQHFGDGVRQQQGSQNHALRQAIPPCVHRNATQRRRMSSNRERKSSQKRIIILPISNDTPDLQNQCDDNYRNAPPFSSAEPAPAGSSGLAPGNQLKAPEGYPGCLCHPELSFRLLRFFPSAFFILQTFSHPPPPIAPPTHPQSSPLISKPHPRWLPLHDSTALPPGWPPAPSRPELSGPLPASCRLPVRPLFLSIPSKPSMG